MPPDITPTIRRSRASRDDKDDAPFTPATIEMEDARPGISGAITDERTLAPQEVYAPGRDGVVNKGEIVLKSGAAVSKDEMTREDKNRRRRREKRARAKQYKQDEAAVEKGEVSKKVKEASEKKQLVSELKKGGVKVIGKGGSLTDVTGNKAMEGKGADEPRKLKL
ncbi:hypothetical protein KEM56_004857 [Ascosphaera pollenicola]|nr:hypothetical protein KEM56_004857 [Ascosphaera pollenicola]